MGLSSAQGAEPAMAREDVCYVERALEVLGGKWTILLIHELMEAPKRFGDLRRAIPEASAKMLTMRLRELEAAGLLEREVFAEVPPHVEYRLTPRGKALRDAIEELRKWGVEYCPCS
jgi:DNA-binding HxlR family transcriptional regulator